MQILATLSRWTENYYELRVILNQKSAAFDAYHFIAGVFCFKQFLFSCNNRCIFNFIIDHILPYHTNAQLPSDTDVYSTRGANSSKVKCFSHTRKEDELCFQFAAIRDWNSLPNSINSIKCKATFDKHVLTSVSNCIVSSF